MCTGNDTFNCASFASELITEN
uniref:Uncharacterized protein n=1 Tax=Arundo donax TaxID=35708 RepID=A0A0A9FMS5_ARUDO